MKTAGASRGAFAEYKTNRFDASERGDDVDGGDWCEQPATATARITNGSFAGITLVRAIVN